MVKTLLPPVEGLGLIPSETNKIIFHVLLRQLVVGCFRFSGPLRQYFSLYLAVSQREGERGEKE